MNDGPFFRGVDIARRLCPEVAIGEHAESCRSLSDGLFRGCDCPLKDYGVICDSDRAAALRAEYGGLPITMLMPKGKRKVRGFWQGRDPETGEQIGGYGAIELDEYPPSPEGADFKRARTAARVTPSTLADELGVGALLIYWLEEGRATMPRWGWLFLHSLLAELREP